MNQGAFGRVRVRDEMHQAVLDGGVGKDGELWTGTRCTELMEAGLPQAKKALQEEFVFNNMIEEWIDCTLDSSIHCNTATDYTGGSKNHEDVKAAVEIKRKQGMVCNRCILNGKHATCTVASFGGCCNNCRDDPACNSDDPCIYQFCILVYKILKELKIQ